MENENTVEVAEPVVKSEPAKAPTRDDLREKGWSKKELDIAEKHGMVSKPEEKKVEPKKEPEIKAEEKKEESKPEVKAVVKQPDGSLNYQFTPEEQAIVDANFGKGHPFRAFYFRAKNERHARQASEARLKEIEAENQALKARTVKPEPELDAEGDVIDPENQPLTLKALKDLQKAEAEEYKRLQAEQNSRQQALTSAQTEQEEYARSVYADFDDTVNRAKEVMQNLDALIPEKWKQTKVVKLIRDLQVAAANADKIGLDEYNAALIAYEIGQMHPEHGKAADKTGTSKENPKGNGSLTPEQMERVQANNQRRGSSASIPAGGGRRTISVEDVDLTVLNAMTYDERSKFKDKHPEQYRKLLRG